MGSRKLNAVIKCLGIEVSPYPVSLDQRCQKGEFLGRRRPTVKVRCPTGVRCGPIGIDLDELEALRYNATRPGAVGATVDNRVLEVDEYARRVVWIRLIDEHGALTQESVVSFDGQVDRAVK
jgi:hypothetical protein